MQDGRYTSMSNWSQTPEGNLLGTMELPMAVGIVGGASKVHPAAQANLAILGVETAQELAGITSALVLRKTSVHFGRSQRKASRRAT